MRPAVFALGILTLAAVWLGPLPQLAPRRFSAHMTMHMGVVAVAASLLALGMPAGDSTPRASRRRRPADERTAGRRGDALDGGRFATILTMLDPAMVERLQAAAAGAFAARGMLAAYAYGSRVAGRPRRDSDLDVGYYLENFRAGARLSVRDEMLLAAELEQAIQFEVDLRDLADAPLELRGRVLEDGVRIYSGDAARRVALERHTLSRYHDYKAEYAAMHERRLRATAIDGL